VERYDDRTHLRREQDISNVMTADEIAAGSVPDSNESSVPNRWLAVVGITALGVTIVHLLALVGNHGPVLYSDALGYLGNARFLAGGAAPTFDGSFSYAAGYSLLLVPLYWITEQSEVVWTMSVAINVGLSVLIMLPAYQLGRRVFDLGRYQALFVSVAVSLTPALILQPGRIWVETLFPLVFLLASLAVFVLFETLKVPHAVLSGALVGYLVFIHGRGLAVAAAFLIVLAIGVVSRRLPLLPAVVGAISTASMVVIDLLCRSLLRDHLWSVSDAPANVGSVGRILGAYVPDHLVATLSTGLGQVWYVIVASFGVAAVGFIALVMVAFGSDRRSPSGDPNRTAALFALLAVGGVAILSTGLLAEVNRVDHRVYGRYLDGVTPILILAGTAWLLKSRTSWRWLAVAAPAIPAAGLALYTMRGSEQFVGNVQQFAIPGLLGLQWIVDPSDAVFLDGLDVLAISALAAFIGIVAALLVRRHRVFGVAALIILTVAITFIGKTTSWDPFVSFWFEAYDNVPTALNDLPQGHPIKYDLRFLDPDARNLDEFRLAPRRLSFVNDACDATTGDALISSGDPDRVGASATPLAADTVPDQGLWLIDMPISEACGQP
jgi:hypothetical protein